MKRIVTGALLALLLAALQGQPDAIVAATPREASGQRSARKIEVLDQLGGEGWELVAKVSRATEFDEGDERAVSTTWTFKRRR